ncbi:MAG: hypothetical protein ACOYW3_04375 [Bacteroidota bacterium]
MKQLLLLFSALSVISPVMAQWIPELSTGYVYSSPIRGMKQTISRAHGVQLFAGLTNPSTRITYGLEFSYGGYASDKSEQEYQMDNGTFAPMSIVVNSGFMNLLGVTRLNLLTHGTVRPYALFKGGYSWYKTNLNIYDEDDYDQCEPVESELLQKDGALIYSIGGGVQVNLSNLFRRAPRNFLYLDLQTSMTSGGRVTYMNSKAPSTAKPLPDGTQASDLTAEFVNVYTQVRHPHHVGYVYSSFINMMDFRLGFTIKPAF